MAANTSPVKALLRAVVAAAALAGLASAGTPALAASNHPFQTFRSENGNGGGAFNLDQDPCHPGAGRHRGRLASGACPDFDRDGPGRGNGQLHRPGSRAFGLQFNNDGY